MKKTYKLSFLFIAFALLLSFLCPQAEAKFPKTQGYVSDFAGIIPSNVAGNLKILAQELERKTGTEMAIVTIPDLGGNILETYAVDLFEQWGIGKKGKDNGVLILVAKAERKVRIEVGYGLEGIIPDGRAGQIIREQITPAFKAGDYGAGLLQGAFVVSQLIAKDAGVQLNLKGHRAVYSNRRGRRKRSLFGSILNFIFFILILFFSLFRRLLFPFGYRRRGYWSSGLGGFGGGFGGGGGGFGGGMSGGSGASGGW